MRIVLLGAGRSGVGAARLLKDKSNVILVNEKEFAERNELEALGIKVIIQDFESFEFKADDYVIKAPGIRDSAYFPRTFSEIDLVKDYGSNYELYAISATNGKTTTTTMLGKMLAQDFKSITAGNIGYALSQSLVDYGNIEAKVALEVSAFQMDGIVKADFEVYALMNLTPDHLDRYGNSKAYYNAKMKIFPKTKKLILNADDENIMVGVKGKTLPSEVYYLSLKDKQDIHQHAGAIYFNETKLFEVSDLKLVGMHNLYNASFAAATAFLAGVRPESIQACIQSFVAVEHRMEYVDTIAAVQYFNDSKGTNPEATMVCLDSFENIHWLAGGFDEGNDFSSLKNCEAQIKAAYFYGDSAQKLKEIFPQAEIFDNLESAFLAASKNAKAFDTVVLSPACASYDQYNNFEERGQEFKKLVKTL